MFFARAINSTLYQALIGTGAAGGQVNPQFKPSATPAPRTSRRSLPPASYAACLHRRQRQRNGLLSRPATSRCRRFIRPTLTLEQQFGKNDVFSLSWLGSWGRRLPDFVDTNLPAPTPVSFTVNDPAGTWTACPTAPPSRPMLFRHQPMPTSGPIRTSAPSPTSSAASPRTMRPWWPQYKHRLSHHLSLNANYTWSHAMDFGENNTTGASATALLDPSQHPARIRQLQPECALSASCLHRWRIALALPRTARVSRRTTLSSRRRFRPRAACPIRPASADRPPSSMHARGNRPSSPSSLPARSTGPAAQTAFPTSIRNAFQYPKTWAVDLRASKSSWFARSYKLEFLTEAFNLTNHQNVTGLGTTAYTVSEDTTNPSEHADPLHQHAVPVDHQHQQQQLRLQRPPDPDGSTPHVLATA